LLAYSLKRSGPRTSNGMRAVYSRYEMRTHSLDHQLNYKFNG
jgi:hypothetical protein